MTMLQHAQPDASVADVVRSNLSRLSQTPAEHQNALAGSAPAELSMEAPHQVYTIGLDQLATGAGLASARANGWRYLLRQNNQTVASARTMTDATGAPLFAEFNSGPFVQSTAGALQRAEQVAGAGNGDVFEPRLLQVPALHAMALWLHGGPKSADIVIPLPPAPPPVQAERQYSIDEYLAALRTAAASVDAVDADNLTGGG
jgi:hypothetical protein